MVQDVGKDGRSRPIRVRSDSDKGDQVSAELFEAIEDLDANRVTALLQGGADIHARDEETGKSLLIAAAVARRWELGEGTVPEGTPILDALLAAGADAKGEWSKGSGHTALVEAAYGHDAAAVARLIAAGADPDQVVLWPAGEEDDVVGRTPRLLAVRHGGDGCGLQLESAQLEGRWYLVLMDYADGYGHGPSTPWGPEESYIKSYLEFSEDGTFTGKDLGGSDVTGKWTGDRSGLSLTDDSTEEVTEADCKAGGLALVRSLTDEQTGYRGSATWTYLPARYLHGLPEEGALVDWDG